MLFEHANNDDNDNDNSNDNDNDNNNNDNDNDNDNDNNNDNDNSILTISNPIVALYLDDIVDIWFILQVMFIQIDNTTTFKARR